MLLFLLPTGMPKTVVVELPDVQLCIQEDAETRKLSYLNNPTKAVHEEDTSRLFGRFFAW
jgi:hypothetical protein